ncbi:MAG: non-ribosomal peptide synthetase, partial [Candidatus Binatia bacterium]
MSVKNIEDTYPLAPVQHGMLFHSLCAPQAGVYVQQLICTLHEELDVPVFKRAWERIAERHPVFRTSFRWEGVDEPRQEVHRQVQIPVEEQDWRHFASGQQEERLRAYLEADRLRGFDLAVAPLMRLAFFRFSQAQYRVIWTSHHVLFDGRSRLLVLKELFALYEAFCSGRDLVLDSPPPYRNFIDWLSHKEFSGAEGFWRAALSGFAASTTLPFDHDRQSKTPTGNFGKQTGRLSATVTSALQSLAKQHRLTPNNFFQGAWALLLSRYTGETDVVFGATRAGRHAPFQGVDSIIGLLINTVPVRVRTNLDGLLLPWLQELRAQWLAMRPLEHTPPVKIQQWSELVAGQPLFESIVVFENYRLDSLLQQRGNGWETRDFRLVGATNYPLALAGQLGRELSLEVTYDRHRFADADITRLLGHLTTLLEEMVSDPTRRLSDLALLTKAERHRLLVEWNETRREYSSDRCLHQLFEEQAERTPKATAVAFEEQQLTYRELNERANQLAHYLRKLGVGPEVTVGIYVERSLEMVVGMLGILKAGGAYVPLDPTYPKERLALMLEDAEPKVLLTQQRLMEERIEDGDPAPAVGESAFSIFSPRVQVVCLDANWNVVARESVENPVCRTQSGNSVYVIYTSGSTGRPKGVLIEHRQILNYVNGILDRCRFEPGAIFATVQPLSVDSSQTVIFPALVSGGCLHVMSEDKSSDPQGLAGYFRRFPIDVLKIAPSHLAALQMFCEPEQLLPRQWLVLGGEAPRWDWLQSFQAGAGCKILNHYGPTETTVGMLTYQVPTGQTRQGSTTVPIGRPLSNTQAYLLDSSLQPVPVGISGELHIGGDGLARGYLDRPELTAEKFIPNPFSDLPGARLYKTGDLARYLPDGNIEFLGRIDNQVKIRGFRVELNEIENVLSEHPAVGQAVVLARNDVES